MRLIREGKALHAALFSSTLAGTEEEAKTGELWLKLLDILTHRAAAIHAQKSFGCHSPKLAHAPM